LNSIKDFVCLAGLEAASSSITGIVRVAGEQDLPLVIIYHSGIIVVGPRQKSLSWVDLVLSWVGSVVSLAGSVISWSDIDFNCFEAIPSKWNCYYMCKVEFKTFCLAHLAALRSS